MGVAGRLLGWGQILLGVGLGGIYHALRVWALFVGCCFQGPLNREKGPKIISSAKPGILDWDAGALPVWFWKQNYEVFSCWIHKASEP